ncbi:MAG: hypothetical protein KC636_26600 [Myxococcales bacterium]|nr:hypothetical protein [Myxococcales bacterium]
MAKRDTREELRVWCKLRFINMLKYLSLFTLALGVVACGDGDVATGSSASNTGTSDDPESTTDPTTNSSSTSTDAATDGTAGTGTASDTGTTAVTTTGEPTTGEPTTVDPSDTSDSDPSSSTTGTDETTDTETGEPTDGGELLLKVTIELTAADIVCKEDPQDPLEASWVVTFDNTKGVAPAAVELTSAYLHWGWTVEWTSGADVSVAPDEPLVIGVGEVLQVPMMKVDSVSIDNDPCVYCELGQPQFGEIELTYSVDGLPLVATDKIVEDEDLPPTCL